MNGIWGQQTINTVEEKHQFIASFSRNILDLEATMLCIIDNNVPKIREYQGLRGGWSSSSNLRHSVLGIRDEGRSLRAL